MTRVLLFAKAPRAGLVKTRLARDVGEKRTLAVYRTVGQGVVAAVAAYPLTVWYDPPDASQEMRAWLGEHEFRAQVGDDLGARMAHAFREHFGRGDGPLIAIGADTPDVSAATIAQAIHILDRADVAIGPALDGGYYLLGLKAPHERLFDGVPWGTPDVLQVTERRCQDLDITVGQLGVLRDIDTAEDLRALGM
jgi:rSAM/selenodomain-associated transferase 1